MPVRELTDEELQRLEQTAPAPRGGVRELTPEEAERVAAEGDDKGFVGSAVDFVTGRDRGRGDLPELGSVDTGANAAIGAGFFTTPDEEARRGIIEQNLPGTTFDRDENDNTVVTLPDGQKAFLNAPGFSMQDFNDLLSDAVKFIPAAKLAQGGGFISKMLRAGFGAGATSLGEDAASMPQGSEAGFDFGRATLSAGAGMFGESAVPVARSLARGSNWLTRKRREIPEVVREGVATPEGREALLKLGVDPDSVSPEMAESIVRASEQGVDPRMLPSAARSKRFDVPFTKGQATRNDPILADEELLRGRGDESGSMMRRFDEEQGARLGAARDNLEDQFGGGRGTFEKDAVGGGIIRDELQGKAGALDGAIDDAYGAARDKTAFLDRKALDNLGNAGATLREQGFLIDGTNTPATMRALKELGEVTSSARESIGVVDAKGQPFTRPKIVEQNIDELERMRRVLNTQIGAAANPTDRKALGIVKRQFDQALDGAFDNALFRGDTDTLEALKEARALRAEYGQRFQQNPRKTRSGANIPDPGGKAVESIVEANPTDEEIVNMVFGRARLFDGKNAAAAVDAVRRAAGGSEEVDQTLKQLAFRRLTKQATSGGKFSVKKFITAFDRAQADTPTVMRSVFSENDLKTLQEFRDAAEQLVQPPRTTNPSGTAAALQRYQKAFGGLGMVTGLQQGGIGFGSIGGRIGRLTGRVFDSGRALDATEEALNPDYLMPEMDETTTLAALIAASRQTEAPREAAAAAAGAMSDADAAPPPPRKPQQRQQPQRPEGLLGGPRRGGGRGLLD